jgi:putative transposase
MGNLLAAICHPANVSDRAGARLLLAPLVDCWRRLRLIWADQGYSGPDLAEWVLATLGVQLAIVARPAGLAEFQVVPRRWVVERTQAHCP